MNVMQSLAAILGLGFASGVNLYLGALVTGLAIRFHLVTNLPPELGILAHPAVLVVAGLLFALEFLADKVPVVASIWDAVHTFIRPVGGALLALGAAGHLAPSTQVLAALAGGTLALGTHSAKMGLRLAAHVAPEPATFTAISTAEDVGVTGLLVLAYTHPIPALIILAILIVFAVVLLLRAMQVQVVQRNDWGKEAVRVMTRPELIDTTGMPARTARRIAGATPGSGIETTSPSGRPATARSMSARMRCRL